MSDSHNIVDVQLDIAEKRKFRINNNDSMIVELNTSDMNILSRLADTIPKLEVLQNEFETTFDEIDVEDTSNENMADVSAKLKNIDNTMRELVNYIFDSDVCSVVAKDGSMYDPFEGVMRFEIIIDALLGLYGDNLAEERKKLSKEVSKHTADYVK